MITTRRERDDGGTVHGQGLGQAGWPLALGRVRLPRTFVSFVSFVRRLPALSRCLVMARGLGSRLLGGLGKRKDRQLGSAAVSPDVTRAVGGLLLRRRMSTPKGVSSAIWMRSSSERLDRRSYSVATASWLRSSM